MSLTAIGFVITCILAFLWLLVAIGGTLTHKPRFKNLFTAEEERDWLVQRVKAAKKEVLIASQFLRSELYDPIADALIEKLKENSKFSVRVLAGQRIITNRDLRNKMVTLAAMKNTLPFKDRIVIDFTRFLSFKDFTIIDGLHVYVGVSPPSGAWQADVQENGFFRGWQYECIFNHLWLSCERISIGELENICL